MHTAGMDVALALTRFGFTQLESMVYHELVRQSSATGYRIARLLGKAPPNIYQTLQMLTQKGAIVAVDDANGPQSYIAVPPRQLFAGIKQVFEENYNSALEALENVRKPVSDETVYQLRTVTQVFERAKAMLANATEVIIYDMMPAVFDELRDEISAARARGLQVVGIAYRPEDASATVPFNGEAETEVVGRWPGLGMILIVDGREQLIAQISRDFGDVLNAIYSDSIFLSSILHSAVSSDIRLVAMRSGADDPLSSLAIKHQAPPGLRKMNSVVTRDPDR